VTPDDQSAQKTCASLCACAQSLVGKVAVVCASAGIGPGDAAMPAPEGCETRYMLRVGGLPGIGNMPERKFFAEAEWFFGDHRLCLTARGNPPQLM